MGDDGCSASELRRRYHMGGDLKDDTLTAPQLRARYGIKKNTPGVYHEWHTVVPHSRKIEVVHHRT